MAVTRKVCRDIDSVLEVNRPIQVIIKTNKRNYVYKSTVADFDSTSILITPISRDGLPAHLRDGEKLTILYSGNDATYEFVTHVDGHKKENNITLTLVEKPRKCWKIQRRDFYRLAFTLEAAFRSLSVEKRKGKKVFVPYGEEKPCYVEDISGGGMSFRTPEELEDASYVEVVFSLSPDDEDEEDVIKEIVKIIRTKKINPLIRKGEFEYTYGGSFVSLDEDMQSRIVRFIIRKQIEMRKTGQEED